MIYYHDHMRPTASRERARCGRTLQPGVQCAELLEFETHPYRRGLTERCPACDGGWRRTRVTRTADLHDTGGVPEPVSKKGQTFDWHAEHARRGWVTRTKHEREKAIAALRDFVARHGRPPRQCEFARNDAAAANLLPNRDVIGKLFGSQRAWYLAAGLPGPTKPLTKGRQ